jgi:hypothetical protein
MIFQLSHNGKEFNISKRSKNNGLAYNFNSVNKGVRYWNNEKDHMRKFIKQNGLYLENMGSEYCPHPQEALLQFWGEWEAQSYFTILDNSNNLQLPKAVHKPYFSAHYIGVHNTDPFVFGENFYYANCKQKLKGSGKKLLNLPNESIIIFGSEVNRSEFIIDTVFVVEDSELISDYRKYKSYYPKLLKIMSLDLNDGLADWKRIYKGKMYDSLNEFKNPFSFVPCKVDKINTGFARPIINWKKFNLKKPGAGSVLYQVKYSSTNNFWFDLVAELIIQGFDLGIQIEMPSIVK